MNSRQFLALSIIDGELQNLDVADVQRRALMANVQQVIEQAAIRKLRTSNADMARKIHRTRLKGNRLMGARVMSDPKFEMLLGMFIASHEERRISVSDLCLSTDAPQTTSLRHIERLEAQGFLSRHPDMKDGRRWWIEPTTRAINGVDAYLSELARAN